MLRYVVQIFFLIIKKIIKDLLKIILLQRFTKKTNKQKNNFIKASLAGRHLWDKKIDLSVCSP